MPFDFASLRPAQDRHVGPLGTFVVNDHQRLYEASIPLPIAFDLRAGAKKLV